MGAGTGVGDRLRGGAQPAAALSASPRSLRLVGGQLDDQAPATLERDAHHDAAALLGDLERTVTRPRLHGRHRHTPSSCARPCRRTGLAGGAVVRAIIPSTVAADHRTGRLTPCTHARRSSTSTATTSVRGGGAAPVAALVRLLAPLGIAAPAVRTAVSPDGPPGLADPASVDGGPGYRLTPKGATRLGEAAERIYRVGRRSGTAAGTCWSSTGSTERAVRERVRTGLAFLGYGQLGRGDLGGAATVAGARRPAGGRPGVRATVRRDPRRYRHGGAGPSGLGPRRHWPLRTRAGCGRPACWSRARGRTVADRDVFAVRSELVHGWRKFLFSDPGLPRELLPEAWPGERAAVFFATEADRMRPAADRYVDGCLAG